MTLLTLRIAEQNIGSKILTVTEEETKFSKVPHKSCTTNIIRHFNDLYSAERVQFKVAKKGDVAKASQSPATSQQPRFEQQVKKRKELISYYVVNFKTCWILIQVHLFSYINVLQLLCLVG